MADDDEHAAETARETDAMLGGERAAAPHAEGARAAPGEQSGPVNTILRIYERQLSSSIANQRRVGREASGAGRQQSVGRASTGKRDNETYDISFMQSRARASSGAKVDGEGRVDVTKMVEDTDMLGLRRVNMLAIARRARLPLGALIMSLSESGDRREVNLRGAEEGEEQEEQTSSQQHSGSGVDRLPDQTSRVSGDSRDRSVPIKYIDVSFGEQQERKEHHLSTPNQGFGLLLSPAGATPRHEGALAAESQKSRDAFHDWLSETPRNAPGGNPGSVNVQVALPEDQQLAENQGLLVLDPTSVTHGEPPQWVFAVPSCSPDEFPGPCEDGCIVLPSEVANVTVYCEQGREVSSLANVVISVELSQPPWAWFVLFVGVFCASLGTPIIGRLNSFTDNPACTSLWWHTAHLFAFVVLAGIISMVHTIKPSEKALLKSPREGLLPICLLGLVFGVYSLLWIHAGNEKEVTPKGAEFTGATIQSLALHALHPFFIVAQRACRKQRLFTGELLGLAMLLAGLLMMAWPNKESGWTDHIGADMMSLCGALCVAVYLIVAKTMACQLVETLLLLGQVVVAFVPMLFSLAFHSLHSEKLGESCASSWAHDSDIAQWFVALMFLSSIQYLCFVHALRYVHPLAVSFALTISTLLSVFWTYYLFKADLRITGAFYTHVTVPGIFVAIVGVIIALYSTTVKRQFVELVITNSRIRKRQLAKFKLTPSVLQKSQETYESSLYSSASKAINAPQPPQQQR
eukprot:TRINITY_DN12302_c0_g1_i1.p1 TRINITY_DN12302_c0_g1~~TRINITY_DN12302_c0_g1_i1.p1  ORF type:complete len:772 (+),score=283.90 TRINITY_DN12302_c0_g1_i1:74-2317(+)